jgi:hypothetical protein
MGKVFVAEDTILKRHVALKLLPAKFKDGRPNHRTERLVKEARSAASLEHPNAVSIYEIDQSGGVHYIAMELAEGGDLEDLVQLSGPMEVERACQLTAEAAEALSHAHARGIIHRDVKPGNLLLTRNGRCKVCDFGLAAFDDATDSEGRAKCVGTPYYIAPEVAMAKGASAASDIYSLGCTLFFLLTGRPPYSGTSAREVMKQHIGSPLPELRRWRPDLPEKLVAAIEQACAKDPTRRFDTAERFGKILRTFTISTSASGSHTGLGLEHAGGSGGLTPVSGGPPPMSHGMLPPISAAQLAAIMPSAAEEAARNRKFQLNLNPPVVWAAGATVATALLIALGMWLARSPKESKVAAAPPAAPAPVAPTPAVQPAPAAALEPAPIAAKSVPSVPSVPQAPPPSTALPTESPAATSSAGGILNGSMDAVDPKGNIADWYVLERCRPLVRVLKEGNNSFLRLTSTDSSITVHAAQKLDLDPSWRVLTISARMRAANFKEGKNSSGVTISFRGEDDKPVGRWTQGLRVKDDFPWTDRVITADVPPGAKKLYLQCVVSYATGTIDFDDVKVVGQSASK